MIVVAPVPPEELHLRRERHVRCNPALAQYIVDEGFAPVRCEGFFDKETLAPEHVAVEEVRATRGWRRLQELPRLEVPIIEYPLPDLREALRQRQAPD